MDILKQKVAPEKAFSVNGKLIYSLSELLQELDAMTKDEFSKYVNPTKDDFSRWIYDALELPELAIKLRGTRYLDVYIQDIKSFVFAKNFSNFTKVLFRFGSTGLIAGLLIGFVLSQMILITKTVSTLEELKQKNSDLEIEKLKLELSVPGKSKVVFDEKPSIPIFNVPYSRINKSQVSVSSSRVIISAGNVSWGEISDSGSMMPLFGSGSFSLHIKPNSQNDLHIGDIIVYRQNDEFIIHRIIDIDKDLDGWYSIAKGDSNTKPDAEKIRYTDIIGVVVGVIY